MKVSIAIANFEFFLFFFFFMQLKHFQYHVMEQSNEHCITLSDISLASIISSINGNILIIQKGNFTIIAIYDAVHNNNCYNITTVTKMIY